VFLEFDFARVQSARRGYRKFFLSPRNFERFFGDAN